MDIKNLNFIKIKIQDILNKSHKEPDKKVLRLLNGRLNFACPICGDSFSNIRAKRGNLYLANLQYVCYNGGCTSHRMSFSLFLRHFNESVDISMMEEIILLENQKKEKLNTNNIESKLLFDLNEFQKLTGFVEYGNFPRIDDYLKNRGLDKFVDKIKVDIKRDGIWILNLIDGKLIGAQFRNFSKFKPKYVSFPWSHIAQFMKKEINIDSGTLEILDRESLIFGLYNINHNKVVTILEGPIDSFFIDNSVAISGLHKVGNVLEMFEKENRRFLLDNDEDGLKISERLVKNCESVFSWNLFKNNKKIVEKVKDINDVFILNKNTTIENLNKNLNKFFVNNAIDWTLNKAFKE